jgi:hypothetical protein
MAHVQSSHRLPEASIIRQNHSDFDMVQVLRSLYLMARIHQKLTMTPTAPPTASQIAVLGAFYAEGYDRVVHLIPANQSLETF